MAKEHYILRRRGHFFSEAPYEGIDWCKDIKHSCFQYVVTIISPAVKDGILIYHENIVDEIKKPIGSCENMAKTAADRVTKLLIKEGADWNVIQVRLFAHDIDNNAIPKANMEFVKYNKSEDVHLLPLLSN